MVKIKFKFIFIIGLIILSIISNSNAKDINLDKPNIIFIVINSWRADHFSNDIAPNIYKISNEGTYFKKCISSAPTTIISDLSIMTGVYPPRHGVRQMGVSSFNESVKTLAEILKENGYETAGFVGDWALNSRYGFGNGFDIYEDDINLFYKISPKLANFAPIRLLGFLGFMNNHEIKADKVNKKIKKWLDKDHEKPFFLFVHYFDAHMPYESPEIFNEDKYKGNADGSWKYYRKFKKGKIELNEQDINHMINLYDNEISFVDKAIKEILNKINDEDIVIIMGDHGEGFGEHNIYFDHGDNLYDEQIVVPLIIKSSKLPNKIINEQIRTIDVLPTILDLVEIPEDLEEKDGVSIVPLINKKLNLVSYSETFYGQEIISIRTNKWKYILGIDGEELYNLETDPEETKNLAKDEPDTVNNFKNLLLNMFDEDKIELLFKEKDVKIEDIDKKRLRALGYIV